MANLYIPIGIPGCGKSYWADVFMLGKAKIVSTDAIRESLGDVNDQSKNTVVFAKYHKEIREALAHDVDVYADATNLRSFARSDLRGCAREQDKIHYVLFRNALQAIKRNRVRDRMVPGNVMDRMLQAYEQALMDIDGESYDTLTEIKRF